MVNLQGFFGMSNDRNPKFVIIFVLLLGLILIFSPTVFAADNSAPQVEAIGSPSLDQNELTDWPKFRYDLEKTGQSNQTGPSSPDLEWEYKTDDAIYSSPAIDNNGTIYIGSQDSYLYAINPNGTLKWKYETDGRIYSSPALDTNVNIYFGSLDNYLYALNSSGQLKWKYATGDWIWSSPTIGTDGTIYFGSADNYFYALNSDGTLKWKYKTNSTIFSSPAIDNNGIIYIGSQDSFLYAIYPNGTLKWVYDTDDWIDAAPVIAADGTIYVGGDDDLLYALNPNGTLKWKVKTDNDFWSSPAVDTNGNIYIGSEGNALYALNPNGTLKWKYIAEGYVCSPVVDLNGNIFFGSFDHYLYALTPYGELIWKYETGDWVVASPVIGGNGTLYSGNENGYLYAFRSTGTTIASPRDLPDPLPLSSSDEPSYDESEDGCCSVIVHVSPGHDVVSFRRDSSEATDLFIVQEKWFGKDVMKEYKISGDYFFHNIITSDGWIVGAGGGGTNIEMERLAGSIILRGFITWKDLERAQTILIKQQLGHFVIKSPNDVVGIAISRGKNQLSKLFTMEIGTYICSPNNPRFYRDGFNSIILIDPVDASIRITGTDFYGLNRRDIMTYEVVNGLNTETITAWASFDGGALINRTRGSPDNVTFLGHFFAAGSLPKIPGKLLLGTITFKKQINPVPTPTPQQGVVVNGKTVPMQETGIPLAGLVMAVIMVLGGLYLKK
jgi:outer membrane protein assembly factor BamB